MRVFVDRSSSSKVIARRRRRGWKKLLPGFSQPREKGTVRSRWEREGEEEEGEEEEEEEGNKIYCFLCPAGESGCDQKTL